jgi:hypothetical protein
MYVHLTIYSCRIDIRDCVLQLYFIPRQQYYEFFVKKEPLERE